MIAGKEAFFINDTVLASLIYISPPGYKVRAGKAEKMRTSDRMKKFSVGLVLIPMYAMTLVNMLLSQVIKIEGGYGVV